MRRAQAPEQAAADPEAAAWALRTRTRHNEDGTFSLTISGPAELLPAIQAGIEAKRAELQRQRDAAAQEAEPAEAAEGIEAEVAVDLADRAESCGQLVPAETPAEEPLPAQVTDAEALLALAQDALAAEQQAYPAVARRRRPALTVQIDPLSGWGRLADGELLPPSSLRTVMKSLPGRDGTVRLRPVTDADLRRFDLGRNSREASPALRELLGTVDGERCRFPGCTRRKKLHAHHVRLWSDGVAVVHHPDQPWGDPAGLAACCGQLVSAETLPPDHCTTCLDLGYAISVLTAQAA